MTPEATTMLIYLAGQRNPVGTNRFTYKAYRVATEQLVAYGYARLVAGLLVDRRERIPSGIGIELTKAGRNWNYV